MDEAEYTPELIKHLRQRLLDFERERQIALFRFDDQYEIINQEYQIENEVADTEKETVDIQRVQDDIKLEEYEEKKQMLEKNRRPHVIIITYQRKPISYEKTARICTSLRES
ncbi:MAG: hypothetical protein EZS28_040812 [Streblomastix strix]|uniref:Uncharacterized protein n=1 Tax=Streblomastix strix TaxID=222440 RepID=A0A5J4U118_9EUKA|nr:MAG: hypothetical protein EZS28_040812 [Streblomastix strix]